MGYAYVFKKDDALVKAQVTLLMAGIHKSIEDVPNLYNLREAVLEALGGSIVEAPQEETEEVK